MYLMPCYGCLKVSVTWHFSTWIYLSIGRYYTNRIHYRKLEVNLSAFEERAGKELLRLAKQCTTTQHAFLQAMLLRSLPSPEADRLNLPDKRGMYASNTSFDYRCLI